MNRAPGAPFVLVTTLTLTLVAPVAAQAQWLVRVFGGVAVSPRHGFVDLEQATGDAAPMVGAAVGRQWRALQLEAELATAPTFLEKTGDLVDGRLTTMVGTIAWTLPHPGATARVRPYLSGGIGVVWVDIGDALAAFTSQSALGAFTAGGGVLFRVRPRFSVSVDARYLRSQFGDQNAAGFGEEFVAFTRVSGGVVVRF